MAVDLMDITVQSQEKFFEALESIQASVLEGVRTWGSTVNSIVPADLPTPAVPGLDKLPTPAQAVDLGFEFVEKLVKAQKSFTEKIVAETVAAVPAAKPTATATPIRKNA